MSGFEKFNEGFSSKDIICSSLTSKKLVMKTMNMFLKFEINLESKIQRLSDFVLRM